MARITTYQDLEKAKAQGDAELARFVASTVASYVQGEPYKTAILADEYDRQENRTIREFVKVLRTVNGAVVPDQYGSNERIACNFFHRLIVQRAMYSLGNGVSFVQPDEPAAADKVKPLLGPEFDKVLVDAAVDSLKHSVSFLFWNRDRVHEFPMTEFCALPDERDGTMRAGIRFWRLDRSSPMTYVLYEADGYTEYAEGNNGRLDVVQPKRAYVVTYSTVPADGIDEVVGEENYDGLPVVPLWANRTKTSAIVGMRGNIDNYDVIKSGFANDLRDCAQVYWLIENAPAMTDEDMQLFLDKLWANHVASVANADEARVTPYAQDIPHEAREALLDRIQADLYRDFGALDVHTVQAGATNDHIDAAYQPMDEEAAFFEYQIAEAVRALLRLQGIDDGPVFRRSRISNQYEQVQMVAMEAQWLDRATVLRKLPNLTPEEVEAVLLADEREVFARVLPTYGQQQQPTEEEPPQEEPAEQTAEA